VGGKLVEMWLTVMESLLGGKELPDTKEVSEAFAMFEAPLEHFMGMAASENFAKVLKSLSQWRAFWAGEGLHIAGGPGSGPASMGVESAQRLLQLCELLPNLKEEPALQTDTLKGVAAKLVEISGAVADGLVLPLTKHLETCLLQPMKKLNDFAQKCFDFQELMLSDAKLDLKELTTMGEELLKSTADWRDVLPALEGPGAGKLSASRIQYLARICACTRATVELCCCAGFDKVSSHQPKGPLGFAGLVPLNKSSNLV